MKKVKYKCKACGWNKDMPEDWADVKPRFCGAASCQYSMIKSKGRKSFRTNPEVLDITFEEVASLVEEVKLTTIEYSAPKGKTDGNSGSKFSSGKSGKESDKETGS